MKLKVGDLVSHISYGKFKVALIIKVNKNSYMDIYTILSGDKITSTLEMYLKKL